MNSNEFHLDRSHFPTNEILSNPLEQHEENSFFFFIKSPLKIEINFIRIFYIFFSPCTLVESFSYSIVYFFNVFLFFAYFVHFQNCTNIVKRESSCIQAEYQCSDGITCIHRSWVCDGEKDCPSGDDETAPNCQNITCRADQFQCTDKSCISGHFHCSGKSECSDGSDELNCREFIIIFCPWSVSSLFTNMIFFSSHNSNSS